MLDDREPPDEIMVRRSVTVGLSPADAFRLFTDGINEWWPLEQGYSYGGDRAREIFLEPAEGGRFYERFVDGDELQVGVVKVCSPPDRILFTWRSPDWTVETEVDVRFVAGEVGTFVELEHRGFERFGDQAEAIAQRWRNGWPRVIGIYALRAGGGASRSR
jgi:uncharacterized protein YndB with AHSA1/START domain